MDKLGLAEVAVFVAFLALTAGAARWRRVRYASADLSSLPLGILAFLGGVANSLIFLYASGTGAVALNWQVMIRGGVVWLLLFEVIYRTQTRLSLRTFPLHVLLYWVVSPLLSVALLFIPLIGSTASLSDLLKWYSKPENWLSLYARYPYNVFRLYSAIGFVVVSYFIIHRSFSQASNTHQINAVWSGIHGGDMSPSKSQTTRLLCASAFLSGTGFINEVLGYLENKSHGATPELGVDIGVVAAVCQYAKSRAERFDLYLFGALLAGLLACWINLALGIVLFIVAASSIYFYKLYGERFGLLKSFQREQFDKWNPQELFPVELKPAVETALPREDQNLFVYKGFTPFASAGLDLGGWSFTVDVSKPADNYTGSLEFEVRDLYRFVNKKILDSQLTGLVIRDYLFVNGREIRDDREVLPDIFGRPVQRLERISARKYATGSDEHIRHYQWIRVHDWGQELVMSYFLRCSLRGTNMFVEVRRFVLTPLADKCRAIDSIFAKKKTTQVVVMVASSLFAGPFYALFSSLALSERLNQAIHNLFNMGERRRRREIEENLQYDYGGGRGVRSAFSSGGYVSYFQSTDGDFYTKMLEQKILKSIIAFLEEHHIDTSDLQERQTTILNSGVLVQGGDVKAEVLAVGAGAQASKKPTPLQTVMKAVMKGAAK